MPKRRYAFIFLTIITLAFSFGVAAAENTHRAAVEKLLLLMNQDQIMEQMFPQVKQFVMQQFQQENISPEQTQAFEKYFDKIFDVMQEEMSWDKMRDDFIQIYTAVYTEDEVNELIAFYESPIGQKTIAKTPLLMQQSMAVSQKHTQNMMPKILKIAAEMAAELSNEPKKE